MNASALVLFLNICTPPKYCAALLTTVDDSTAFSSMYFVPCFLIVCAFGCDAIVGDCKILGELTRT